MEHGLYNSEGKLFSTLTPNYQSTKSRDIFRTVKSQNLTSHALFPRSFGWWIHFGKRSALNQERGSHRIQLTGDTTETKKGHRMSTDYTGLESNSPDGRR